MDNPGVSLFQGADIQINNSKNIEEEEDLEDQLRRKEEVPYVQNMGFQNFSLKKLYVSAENYIPIHLERFSCKTCFTPTWMSSTMTKAPLTLQLMFL